VRRSYWVKRTVCSTEDTEPCAAVLLQGAPSEGRDRQTHVPAAAAAAGDMRPLSVAEFSPTILHFFFLALSLVTSLLVSITVSHVGPASGTCLHHILFIGV